MYNISLVITSANIVTEIAETEKNFYHDAFKGPHAL